MASAANNRQQANLPAARLTCRANELGKHPALHAVLDADAQPLGISNGSVLEHGQHLAVPSGWRSSDHLGGSARSRTPTPPVLATLACSSAALGLWSLAGSPQP